MGRAEAALALLESPAEIETEPTALLARADALHALKRFDFERATLERTLALHTAARIPSLERLVRRFLQSGATSEARDASEQLLALDPFNAIGSIGAQLSGTSSRQTGRIADEDVADYEVMTPTRRVGFDQARGEAALFLDQPQLAITHLRRVHALHPASPRLLLALGAAFLLSANAESAANAFAAIPTTDGLRFDALFGLADAELGRNNPQRALATYDYILRHDPLNFRALRGRAEAASLIGDNERAAALLAALVRRAPEHSAINLRFRKALDSLGRSYRIVPPSAFSLRVDNSLARSSELANIKQPAVSAARSLPTTHPLLRAGDLVRIEVMKPLREEAELSIDNNNLLHVPFLNRTFDAGCVTEEELKQFIARSTPLDEQNIKVTVERFQRAPVVVTGAVYLAGGYYVRKELDLQAALMLASGAATHAGDRVYVVRGASACAVDVPADLNHNIETYKRTAIEDGRLGSASTLRYGDLLFVPPRETALIVGAVERSGFVLIRGAVTLRAVLRSLGGTLAGARRNRICLFRPKPNDSSLQQFTIDLEQIEQGLIGEVLLYPNDIVEVPSGDTTTTALRTFWHRTALQTMFSASATPRVADQRMHDPLD